MNKQIKGMTKSKREYLKFKPFADDLRKAESWCDLDGVLNRYQTVKNLYKMGYRKLPKNLGEFSDGYHTFNELYHHRAVLFSVICNMMPDKAWKSKLHDTGDMYDGMFIVGIETEQGQATYHYDIDPYWDIFKVKELERAPKYDGHTPSDAIQRIGAINTAGYRKQSEGHWYISEYEYLTCSECGDYYYTGCDSTAQAKERLAEGRCPNFCPNYGAKMKGR